MTFLKTVSVLAIVCVSSVFCAEEVTTTVDNSAVQEVVADSVADNAIKTDDIVADYSSKSSTDQSSDVKRGHEIKKNQVPSAYSEPGRINVVDTWDVFIKAAFLYWQPLEIGLDLGLDGVGATAATISAGEVIGLDFKYKPAFKIGLGMNFDHDNWAMYAQYTWFHNSHSKTVARPSAANTLVNYWYYNDYTKTTLLGVKSKWDVDLDIADFIMQRAYYLGTNLVFTPFMGLRAAWFDQNYKVWQTTVDGVYTDATSTQVKSDSWLLGPMGGLYAKWILGEGFYMGADVQSGLAYQHIKIKRYEIATVGSYSLATQKTVNQVTPFMEADLGLGWGTYFYDNKMHFDLSASYDFHVYWNQNYLNSLATTNRLTNRSLVVGGDYFMHGLTITTRFDF
jgi:hypothetical protein